MSGEGTAGGWRRRAAAALVPCVLVASILAVRFELRVEGSGRGGQQTRALERVFTSGELITAALLGGFRAVLLSVLWVRVESLIERGRFLELPLVLDAVEELQGFSPALYRIEGAIMTLDIPAALRRDDPERWPWIRRGLRALERGTARFPSNADLLAEAGFVYYARFRPRETAERRAYLEDRELNPQGRDPLDAARDLLERALRIEGHDFRADVTLFTVLVMRTAVHLDVDLDRLNEAAVRRKARQRLRDGAVRRSVEAILDRAERLLVHIERVHLAPELGQRTLAARRRWLAERRRDIARFRRELLGAPPRDER